MSVSYLFYLGKKSMSEPTGHDESGSIPPAAPAAGPAYVYTPPPSVFSARIPSAVTLSIGLLLFLLPFLEIRCNGIPIGKFSGVQLATGFRIEAPGTNNTLTAKLQEAAEQRGGQQHDGNPYALAALILSALAVGLSFTSSRAGIAGSAIAAVLAAIALIALMVSLNNQLAGEVSTDDDVLVTIGFTPWFYISVVAALIGALFAYRRLTGANLPLPGSGKSVSAKK